MSTPEPTTTSRAGAAQDRPSHADHVRGAVPAIVIFAGELLGMNFLMALILGPHRVRILFPDDRRVLVVVVVLAIGWAILCRSCTTRAATS